MPDSMLDLARSYLSKGFSIIPLKPRDKRPAIDSWKEFQTRRATDEELEQWFGNGSKYNLGIVTGEISGVTVIDLDSPEAVQFAKDHGFPATPTAKTGKGFHGYFQYKEGTRNFQKRDDLPGIDLRSDGGYVVGPPSVHESGRVYVWVNGRTLEDLPLAPLPEIVLAKNAGGKVPLHQAYKGVEKGSRNDTLARLCGSWVSDGLTLPECMEQAVTWNQKNSPPLPDREIEQTVKSIFTIHHREKSQGTDAPSEIALARLGENEDGDARLFIDLHRGRFLFDAASRRWYLWSTNFWGKDALGEATRAIDAVIEVYGQEAKRQGWQRLQAEKDGRTDDAKRRKETEDALFKRIRALQSVNRKENVLTLARAGANSLAIRGDEWDLDPWLLGCRNGVIDLRTGILRPGTPEDFIKTIAPTEYHGPDTPAPTWKRFIAEICGDYSDHPSYLQRLFGYGVTGLTNWHVYPIFHGPEGRNGKGTLLETLKIVLGDLAYKARSETLLESRQVPQRGSADADTLAFRGKRIIWTSEVGEGRKLNASRIKELVGADTLNARAPYGRDTVEFAPSHLLILLTNARPEAPPNDTALWERLHLIPFNVRFVDNPQGPTEKKADHDLLEKLKPEAPGILAWLVRGCLTWQKEGLNPPETVKAATVEYRKDEDIVNRFLSDCCVVGSDYRAQAGPLYTKYKDWAEEMGIKPTTGILFGKEMKARFDSLPGRHVFYLGVGLLSEE